LERPQGERVYVAVIHGRAADGSTVKARVKFSVIQ